MSLFNDDLAEPEIVFHDEQYLVSWLYEVPVITRFVDQLADNFQVTSVNPVLRDLKVGQQVGDLILLMFFLVLELLYHFHVLPCAWGGHRDAVYREIKREGASSAGGTF